MEKITRYMVTKWRLNSIELQTIERETDKTIWYLYEGLNGEMHERRELKKSEYCSWFDTFQDAKDYVIKKRKVRIEHLKIDLAEANTDLAEAKKLKENK